MKRFLLPVFAAVSVLATASLAPAQSTTPSPSPMASATPKAGMGKHSKKKKKADATPAADATMTPAASPGESPAASTTKKHAPPKPLDSPAPGGGPGMVWVNNKSKAYHQPSSRWYGRTKDGKYMTEEAAKAEGDHAAPGKD